MIDAQAADADAGKASEAPEGAGFAAGRPSPMEWEPPTPTPNI